MELERLQRLSGITEKMTPVKVSTDTSSAVNATRKQAKENNKTPKNKSIDDVRQTSSKSDIDNDVIASLDDIDDNGITVKDGKKDINGNKNISKGERLTYTISIDPKTGAPKVDDELQKDLIDVETWGEGADIGKEGFLVASDDGVYLCYEGNNEYVMEDQRSKAAVFASLDEASELADLFDNSTIRRIVVEAQEKKKDNECSECGDDPCTCKKEEKSSDDKESCEACDCGTDKCICKEDIAECALLEAQGNILDDIKGRLDRGEEVKAALQYQNDMFTGYVRGVSNNLLDIEPTPKTKERYKLQDKNAKLPIDPTSLQWSPKVQGLLRGKARQLQNAPSSTPGPDQNQTRPERKPFFPGAQGTMDNPSSWAVDMSSEQKKGRPLNEYMEQLKEAKKREKTPSVNNLVAKHARKFNKAAVHTDRKKDAKRGNVKHKKDITQDNG